MRNITPEEFENIKKSTGEEKQRLIDETIRKMFPEKNHDLTFYKPGVYYTWKGFTHYEEDEKGNWGHVPKVCKFKVNKIYHDDDEICCEVEYGEGPFEGEIIDVPLADMPPTVERR